jgi:hypothetical protein
MFINIIRKQKTTEQPVEVRFSPGLNLCADSDYKFTAEFDL